MIPYVQVSPRINNDVAAIVINYKTAIHMSPGADKGAEVYVIPSEHSES